MLEVRRIAKSFGGCVAVDQVTASIAEGTVTGLIGPNGAGKTTLFNLMAGMLTPNSGRVFFLGKDITSLSAHERFGRGLLRTFQIAREFASLSVRENLMAVPPGQSGETLLNAWIHRSRIAREEEAIRQRADEVLSFLTIDHLADEPAGNLSGGQKKLLELGRTMMAEARIVLLDEVGAGVNPTLLNALADAILRLNRERGCTFCMIEHNMSLVSRLCDPVIVMAEGRILTEGNATDVMSDTRVIESYLGSTLPRRRTPATMAVA